MVTLTVRFDAAKLDEPHRGRVGFVQRAGRGEARAHTDGDGGLGRGADRGGHLRLGPYRAATDSAGRVEIKIAKGGYELARLEGGI